MTAALPRVSIVVPCRNEERFIGACLDSILAADYPQDRLEVLVADGLSTDATPRIIDTYAARHAFIRRIDNPDRIVPAALNRAVRLATGDIIMRMDAHAVYPRDYIRRLVEALATTAADNVGGSIRTVPARDGPRALGIACALSHPFGVGNSRFRIGTSRARWVDTVPFGCYRRDVFRRIGFFDEELVRNQDDEFNHRLIRHGGRILLVPDVVSTYYARESFARLARMFHQYGFFKPLALVKLGRLMTFRQLIPPAFVLGLALLLLLAPLQPLPLWLWLIPVWVYLALVIGCALPVARAHGVRAALALAAAFPVLHVSYGVGFLRGLFALARRRGHGPPALTVPLSR